MTALAMPEWSLLGAHLAPVADLMNDETVSEIAVNRPGEIWIERAGAAVMERRDQPEFTAEKLLLLANAVAARSNQRISPETPLLSARLPGGERIQLVAAPVIEAGVALAIRRQVMRRFSLDDYEETGFFDRAGIVSATDLSEEDKALAAFLKAGEMRAFLETAVRARRNVVVSGGTSSGKTTFANALIGAIPVGERLVTIEDARELDPPHANTLAMVALRGGQGRAKVDATQLLEASLRLRPDRILLGELRGAEAYSWIRAVNTGHPGSITTVHADTPGGALDQIAFMVMQSGVGLGFEPVKAYVRSVVDIIIQLRRVDGARRIDGIWHRASEIS